MIVTLNEKNREKYNALFAKAYQLLDSKNLLKPEARNDMGRFLTLEDYFAHMEELVALDGSYALLPIDELPFEINADTRKITAPKVVLLQKDQISKIIVFTVDRYFDFKDLNETQIWVQWSAPGEGGQIREGASEIEIRDLVSIPGKMRLGWLMDDEITAYPGSVKYSVRFWESGKVKNEEGELEDRVIYSLNTVTSALEITPSLQPKLNEIKDVNTPVGNSLFKKVIKNSQITGQGIPAPLNPVFGEPGLNLDKTASLNDSDTLTLKAQAYVGDTGAISYEWWYTPAVDIDDFKAGVEYPYNSKEDMDVNGNKITIPGFGALGGTVEESFEPVENLTALLPGEQYYVQNDAAPKGYVAYPDTVVPDDITLYERYTTYTVPADEDVKVTGKYRVSAINSLSASKLENASMNISAEVFSEACELISPDEVVFDVNGNLPARMIMNGAPLKIETIKQASKDAVMTYTWEKGTDSEVIDEEVADANSESNIYSVLTPGYYRVTPSVKLNRESKFAVSDVCKVTFEPKIPATSYGPISSLTIDENKGGPVSSDLEVVLDLDVENIVPTDYAGYDVKLFSDGMTYTWIMREVDNIESARVLTEADTDIVVSGLGTSVLTVKNPGNETYMFKCLITNTLNGKTVSQAEEDALPFYIY